MSDQNETSKTEEILTSECTMLEDMIADLAAKHEEGAQAIEKLTVVRDALKEKVDSLAND